MNSAEHLRDSATSWRHLDDLESEAIHILREVAAECANPVLLFSGGKDSTVLLRLSEKAFRPGAFPFPPLNAVLGFSEIMKNETMGPIGNTKYREYADDIHDSGKHLLGLINDILDLSKIESGTEELHEDKIEIPEFIGSILKLVGHRAEQGGVKLELEIQDPLPALRAEERKLKQILVNLISNAIQFSTSGGVVALWAWCRPDSGHVFQIIDIGIGIAHEDIPKALSRFGQVDGDLDRQYEGTGLGLPLTTALIELHGGTLDLQSRVDVGTIITVRFPTERIVHSPRDTESVNVGCRS